MSSDLYSKLHESVDALGAIVGEEKALYMNILDYSFDSLKDIVKYARDVEEFRLMVHDIFLGITPPSDEEVVYLYCELMK